MLFKHWLVKEPASDNPFILIFKVLRYAIKNKYPRLRSAFPYLDDKPRLGARGDICPIEKHLPPLDSYRQKKTNKLIDTLLDFLFDTSNIASK